MKQKIILIIMFMLTLSVFGVKLNQYIEVTVFASEISISADALCDPVNEVIRVSGTVPNGPERTVDILMVDLSGDKVFYSNTKSLQDGIFNFEIGMKELSLREYNIVISSGDYEDVILDVTLEHPDSITYSQFSTSLVQFLKEEVTVRDSMMAIEYNIVSNREGYLTNRDLIKSLVKIFEIRCSTLRPGALYTVFDNCTEFSQDDAYYINKAVQINLFSDYTSFYPDDCATIDFVRYAITMLREGINVFELFYDDSKYIFLDEGKRLYTITDGENVDFYYTDKDTEIEKSISFAVYDKNGKMLSVVNNIVTDRCGKFYIFYASLSQDVEEASVIKAFVWNKNMTPLCEVISLKEDLHD